MNKIFWAVGLTTLLGGCSLFPEYVYKKEGASEQATKAALAKCDYQVRVNKIPLEEQATLKNLCMRGEGFESVRVN